MKPHDESSEKLNPLEVVAPPVQFVLPNATTDPNAVRTPLASRMLSAGSQGRPSMSPARGTELRAPVSRMDRRTAMSWAQKLLVAGVMVTAAIGFPLGRDADAARTGAEDRVVVRGRANLDGAPFDAPYLGAAVKRHGLVTPCQHSLPRVRDGRFAISVLARTEGSGCGAAGSEIFLWTFVQDQIVYSSQPVRWLGNGKTARFNPGFSISEPAGGVGPVVGFAGEIFDGRNRRLPPGAHVEAYIGKTRCAVATTRCIDNFTGFSIDVVGPDSIPGCEIGATIAFRVDGRDAYERAVDQACQGGTLNLSLQ